MSARKYLFGGSAIVLAAALGFAQSASAQDTEVEEVIVTGSFIAGTPEDAALPVDVIGSKELEQRGAPTMTQLIKTIPSSGAVIGENNRFGAGNGTATINLRNLNSVVTGPRTLVLFNGRRVGGSTRSLGSVDINIFPPAAIGRIEVLKDGAAATYGSDAIGGVVNFITRKFEGFEVAGNYQAIDGSNGDYNVSAAYGWQGDRADLLLVADYRRRSELEVAERDWALRTGPAGYLQNPLGGWAGTGNPGLYNYPTTAPVGSPNTGFTSATFTGSLMDIGCAANGGAPYALTTAIASPTSCNFQYTSFDNLVENEHHYGLYGEINFDLTDTVKFHAEALWNRNYTPNQSWAMTGPNQYPAPILASGASAGGGVSPVPAAAAQEQSRFYIPNTNPGLAVLLQQVAGANCTGPVLPYGVDAASCATGLAAAKAGLTNAGLYGVIASPTAWRPIGFAGNPYTDDRHSHYRFKTDTWRLAGSLSGELWEGKVGWQAALTYQEVDYRFNLQDVSVNRLQLGLRGYGSRAGNADQCTAAETANFTSGAGNAALGCFYFNPFTNAFAQSLSDVSANPYHVATSTVPGFNDAAQNRAAIVDWMEEEQHSNNTTHLFVADLIFNGETGIELGGGAVAWAAGAQYRWDRYQRNPQSLYDVDATPCVDSPPFGDGAPFCPLAASGPFLFNANIGQYDVSREIISGFAELKLPITEQLEVSLAARYEEYQGLGNTFNPKASARWQVVPWLAFRGAIGSTYRAPLATFTVTGFDRNLTNASGTYRANDLYGNPDLKPETANTYSLGAIFEMGGFNATLDYWRFDFKDQMTTEATTDLLAIAMPTTGGCGPAALLARLTLVSACDPAATATVNRARILSYRTQYINAGDIRTEGLDFQANLDLGDVLFGGRLQVGFDGTYLLKYDEQPYSIEGVPVANATIERAGTYRASIFIGYNRLRANAYLNWTLGRHNLRWQVRHVSSVNQAEALAISLAVNVKSTSKVAEYWQNDLTYTVQLPWDATGTLGVQNIFNEDPPFAIGTQYNYDPGSGTPLGRVFVVGLKKRF